MKWKYRNRDEANMKTVESGDKVKAEAWRKWMRGE